MTLDGRLPQMCPTVAEATFQKIDTDPLNKWRLDLNNNTLYILSLNTHVSRQKLFLMNVRLRMYKYCY